MLPTEVKRDPDGAYLLEMLELLGAAGDFDQPRDRAPDPTEDGW